MSTENNQKDDGWYILADGKRIETKISFVPKRFVSINIDGVLKEIDSIPKEQIDDAMNKISRAFQLKQEEIFLNGESSSRSAYHNSKITWNTASMPSATFTLKNITEDFLKLFETPQDRFHRKMVESIVQVMEDNSVSEEMRERIKIAAYSEDGHAFINRITMEQLHDPDMIVQQLFEIYKEMNR